jgi:CP family cyanate transporter-like MFS transporter
LFFGVLHEQNGNWTLPFGVLALLSLLQMLLAPLAAQSKPIS